VNSMAESDFDQPIDFAFAMQSPTLLEEAA
jgi:hypothetical protein